jgi:hypothetical protein
MKNLVYLSYGTGLHELEITFSVLSAYRWIGVGRPDWRIVVYTDRPETFSPLDVATVVLDAKTLQAWAGPSGFGHRRKIVALRDALDRFAGPSALLDGDTYFRRSPNRLLARIGPGRAVMHLREGSLGTLPGGSHADLKGLLQSGGPFTDLVGEPLSITAAAPMWNSGVVGVHPSDSGLLDDAIHLTDQFCRQSRLHTLEQFALGLVLERRARLREAGDVVFHYWDRSFRDPFHRILPGVLSQHAALSLAERARLSYTHRPRSSFRRRCRSAYNRVQRTLGLVPPVVRSSE